MLKTRLIAFVIIFTVLSVTGITLANIGLQRNQNEAKEEVEGLQDISGVPRVVNIPPVEVLVADHYEYLLSVVDSDTPISEIELVIQSGPSWIRTEGLRIYGIPSAQDIGTHEIHYTLSDGVNTVSNSFYVVVSTDE